MPFLQASHLVDAVVARAVDLLDVEVLPGRDLDARRALVAGRRGGSLRLAVRADAVQALGQKARARRLADAANAGEEERVGDATARDGVRQRSSDVVLSDEILERLRAVLAGEDEVAHDKALTTRATEMRECPGGPAGLGLSFAPSAP